MPNELRQPRVVVLLGGVELPGVVAVNTYNNNFFAADRFQIRIAAQTAPLLALQQPDQRYEVQISVDGVSKTLIVGAADCIALDPVRREITIDGRDLSSLLIQAQSNETFPNRTASEIATLLAGRHGLAALVDATTTPVGRYYQSEHDRVTLGQFSKATTEWDLLAFLATREGYDLFMAGDLLRFGAAVPTGFVSLSPSDCIALKLEHNIPLSRPMEVTVQSWNSKSATSITATATTSGHGLVWRRMLVRPNLSGSEADTLARRTVDDLKRHEWSASVTMPGELALSPRSRVALVATNSGWDRLYTISQISRHLDVERGFTQRLSLQGATDG